MTSRPSPAQWQEWMRLALEQAQYTEDSADVPVGAIVLDSLGNVIGRGHNTRERDADPIGHAEINALRDAARFLGRHRLENCTLVVTLEPCVMCAGAIGQSGISRLIYGAADPKAGAAGGGPHDLVRDRSLPYRVDEVIGGVLADKSSQILHAFFDRLRQS